ncbi:MAG: GNAT family N-acetyltransferase [Acidobacteriota bacterium]
MPELELVTDRRHCQEEARRVFRELTAFNIDAVGDDSKPLHLFLRDDDGELLGGLIATTYWGWLAIDTLWVDAKQRGNGHGHALLTAAETEAVDRGCQQSLLDTFSFQARPFYERHGYRVVATLPSFPPGHERYYLTKTLVPQD